MNQSNSSRKRNAQITFTHFLLVCILLQVPTVTSKQVAEKRSSSAVTNAYGEPIKWSFGGWAPLDGSDGSHPGNHSDSSNRADPTHVTPPLRMGSLSTTEKPAIAPQIANKTLQNKEALTESASSSHGSRQYRPAYTLPAPERPLQFSPPAPAPIVREYPLVSAGSRIPKQQQHHLMGNRWPAQAHMQMLQAQAGMVQHQAPPPAFYAAAHQRQMQQHQQHMHQMRMHHLNNMNQQYHHQQPPHHQQQMQQQQQMNFAPSMMHHPIMHQQQMPPYRLAQMNNGQHFAQQSRNHHHQTAAQAARPRSIPRYPGSPLMQHPQQQQQMVPSYKLVEGEQPIIFTHSLSEERIPVLEVSGAPRHTNNSSQAAHTPEPPASHSLNEQQFASTLAAIEKDNLNYQNALNKVVNQPLDEPQQQSTPIASHQHNSIASNEENKYDSKTGPSYLTIPVAVETDGDKVLTADDISEIEKHVIRVLPNGLRTADKIVKMADAQLSVASYTKEPEPQIGPIMHQLNYQEHQTTLKELEGDLRSQQQQQQHTDPTSPVPTTQTQTHPMPTTIAMQEPQTQQHPTSGQMENTINPQQLLDEQEYYVASGPLRELGTLDQDGLGDYNLIKNDLLHNFRYEPTRANPSHSHTTHTLSTPPMPYGGGYNNGPPSSSPAPSITRYFHQGPRAAQHQVPRPYQRGRSTSQQPQQQPQATTRTLLGGRKVSEVMRPLIHTTPVPMTSPMHVPSLEPEKVDAIQLIAGHTGNDKQPMVVEAHQLVNHTPDGGIDYNSGVPMHHQNQTIGFAEDHQANRPQQQYIDPQQLQQQQHNQERPNYQQEQPADNNQGAIIEYVSMSDQHAPENQQTYEVSGHPEVYNNNNNNNEKQSSTENPISLGNNRPYAPSDYTLMPAQQHQQGSVIHTEPETTPAYAQQQQGQAPQQQPSLAWSPSVASEHQQQQAELNEHAAPMQQNDLPATAGYNFFPVASDQQEQQPVTSTNQQYQVEQEHQEQQPQKHAEQSWRTKAGGRQPNPDAQYDGQIVKGGQQEQGDQQDENVENNQHEQQQQSVDEQQQYSNYGGSRQSPDDINRLSPSTSNSRTQEDEQQQRIHNSANDNADAYQQQQQRYQEQLTTPSSQTQTTGNDGYLSTNSFVAGAQINHPQSPSLGQYEQQQQQQQHFSQPEPDNQYTYMKLDRDRQQNHLARQQVQHQAQRAEVMNSQRPYQTTTPMTLTTNPAAENQNEQQQQQQYESNDNTGYMVEQAQSRPSVQSQPDSSLIVNESPIQMPILDQQSLIPDTNQGTYEEFSDDDAAKQRQQSQPAAVYQVYQAYYAPKDHKPLPGYVRLTLEEFNELFRDAEIQYVDRNLNGIANILPNHGNRALDSSNNSADYAQQPSELMRSSASEQQSILVDKRSLDRMERRSSSNSSDSDSSVGVPTKSRTDRKLKLGLAIKKVISIRNVRQSDKQIKSKLAQHKSSSASTTTKPSTTSHSKKELTSKSNRENTQASKSTQISKRKIESAIKNTKLQHQSHNNQPKNSKEVAKIEASSIKRKGDGKAKSPN